MIETNTYALINFYYYALEKCYDYKLKNGLMGNVAFANIHEMLIKWSLD
jgi:hypothetical protein